MGEKHLCGHQTSEEISSGNLRRGGPCNPIGVDFFEMHDKRYGTGAHGIGKSSVGNLFASSFLENRKPSLLL